MVQLNSSHYKSLILNNFKTINFFFISSICAALIILFSKFYGLKEFSWNDIVFPLKHSWIVFLLLTLASIYFSLQLERVLKELLRKDDKKLNKEIYLDITSSENIFIRGLNSTPIITGAFEKSILMAIPPFKKDMAYWLRLSVTILILIAIIWPMSPFSWKTFINNFYLGAGIVYCNGLFASKYLVKFYLLAHDINENDRDELI